MSVMEETPHILIVEARYYSDVADELAKGATQTLSDAGCTYSRVTVPGALEIPAAVRYAVRSMEVLDGENRYHGYVALGCVIRGETSHYDHVCGESIRGLQDLALRHSLAIGCGILTVENKKQAMARALVEGGGKGNKGGFAAQTCLDMIAVKKRFGLRR